MPLLRTEEHEGLKCRFYDGGVVMVGTTAADRFTIRLKDDDDFPTRSVVLPKCVPENSL